MKHKILNDLLTGADNKTHDIARWSWMISLFAVLFATGYELIHNTMPSIKDFAEAVGIISGAHGAAVMLKKDSEPKEQTHAKDTTQ
jgi:hypothetical protein